MEIQLGVRPNCSEWDMEIEPDYWPEDYIPENVKTAIEEAKLQVGKEWDK